MFLRIRAFPRRAKQDIPCSPGLLIPHVVAPMGPKRRNRRGTNPAAVEVEGVPRRLDQAREAAKS
jgi:hypothetical protein